MMNGNQQQQEFGKNGNRFNICNRLNNVKCLDQTFNHIPISSIQQYNPNKEEHQGSQSQTTSRSHKNEYQFYVSSFEKDIIKEHLDVAQKFLPFLFTISVPGYQLNLISKLEGHQLSKINEQTIVSLIKQQIVKIWKGERKKPSKNPQMPITLLVFLGRLIRRLQSSKLRNTIALTFEIWNEYVKTQDAGEDESKMLIVSTTISQKIAKKWKQSFMSIEAYLSTLNALTAYCTTILLVANQYFQNPYYEDPQKRPSPQDSSESDKSPDKSKPIKIARPHKKRHQNTLQEQM